MVDEVVKSHLECKERLCKNCIKKFDCYMQQVVCVDENGIAKGYEKSE